MQKSFFVKIKPYRFRILSGFLFCIFLVCTWLAFYQKPKYPENLHISLQEQLKSLIQETLLKKQPAAQNLQFQKMWTQATYKKDQISAHFQYSFDDKDGVNVSVSGKALMNRKSVDSSRKYDLWSVDHIQTSNTSLKFEEPITLFSGKLDSDEGKDTEDNSPSNENKEEGMKKVDDSDSGESTEKSKKDSEEQKMDNSQNTESTTSEKKKAEEKTEQKEKQEIKPTTSKKQKEEKIEQEGKKEETIQPKSMFKEEKTEPAEQEEKTEKIQQPKSMPEEKNSEPDATKNP